MMGPGVIKNDNIYFSGLDATYAYELLTGKLKWRTPLVKHSTCPIVIGNASNNDEFLFTSTEDGFVRCLNPENGIELWKVNAPKSINPLLYHDGHLYYRGASENIKVLSTKTQKLIWDYQLSENKKNKDRFVNTYIIPDLVTGKVYTTDYIDVYCFNPVK
jgi:outer membrane protein assembly factor BamB